MRLSVIERLFRNNAIQAQRALYRLAAQVTGDSKRNTEEAKRAIDEFVFEKNLELPVLSNGNIQIKTEETTKKIKRHTDFFKKLNKQQKIYSEMNFIELLAEIRLIHRLEPESEDEICFINAFGYRLSMLIDEGHENDVIRLLRFFGRNYSSRDDLIHPVGKIAEGLDRLGYERVVVVQ